MARSLEVLLMSLHYCTFGLETANDAQNVSIDTAHGKDNDQQNYRKRYCDIAILFQMSEDTVILFIAHL